MNAESDRTTVSPDVIALVARYRRRERAASAGVVLVAVALAAGTSLLLSLLPWLAVVVAVGGALRVPIYRTEGAAALSTEADPATVRADFESACPPPLALQWGVADAIERTDDGWGYDFTYLFGLRSTRLTVEAQSGEDDNDLELVVTAGDRPWGRYAVQISEREDGGSTVELTFGSARRFGLRRIPQWLVAEQYREQVLEAQGYSVTRRTAGLRL